MASSDTLSIFVPDPGVTIVDTLPSGATVTSTGGEDGSVISTVTSESSPIENVGLSYESSPTFAKAFTSGDTSTTFVGASNLTSLTGTSGENIGIFQGKSNFSFVDLGDGDDTFTGSNVRRSSVDLGEGDNTLTVGQVNQATFTSGSGADEFTVTGNAKNLTIDSGAGDDTLIFGGTVGTSNFMLGEGADSISFDGLVRQTTIDLGGDTDIDTISFSSMADLGDRITVTGAGDGDLLVIGGEEYVYDSSVSGFVDGTETITFG
jgi:hypothetical protein